MAELSPVKKFIQQAEVKYKAAISEITATKMGGMLNFLGQRLHERIVFDLNGPYYVKSVPQLGVAGLLPFEFDAEIFNVFMYSNIGGASGTTELDVKRATNPGGAFTSIFSTTPKIDSTAADYVWIGVGETVAGCVAPVLSSLPFNVSAGDALRLDKIQHMAGGQNAGIIIHYRPR